MFSVDFVIHITDAAIRFVNVVYNVDTAGISIEDVLYVHVGGMQADNLFVKRVDKDVLNPTLDENCLFSRLHLMARKYCGSVSRIEARNLSNDMSATGEGKLSKNFRMR